MPTAHSRSTREVDLLSARPKVLVHTRASIDLAVSHWLLAAASDRAQARRDWQEQGVAVLACGALFSAVRMPAETVHAAAGSTDHATVDAYLSGALLGGPVICDNSMARYYALVPAGAARKWDVPGTVCLGIGWSVGVPPPGRAREDGWARMYWSVPMDSPGVLCSAGSVQQLVMTGRFREVSRG